MELEKKDSVYSVLEKKWYINFDEFIKKLRKRLDFVFNFCPKCGRKLLNKVNSEVIDDE